MDRCCAGVTNGCLSPALTGFDRLTMNTIRYGPVDLLWVQGIVLVSQGVAVNLFYIDPDGKDMFRKESADYGAMWGEPLQILNPATNCISWLAGTVSDSSALVLFYASTIDVIYVIKKTCDSWGNPSAWTNTVASVTGIDCVYQGVWNLVVTGTESTTSDAKARTRIYGDGVDQTIVTWSALREIDTAKSDSDVSFH
jgi:hypothetical protein